jgi:hypothetical protein
MTQLWGRYALVLLFAGLCALGIAAEKKSSSSKSSSKSTRAETVKQEPTAGRLPRYFASLVDDEQREEIYQIQAKYGEKIAELEKELAELEKEQLKAMEKVLTADQRKELDALRSATVAKKTTSSPAKKK